MATLQKKYDELLEKYNKLKEEKEIAQVALDLTDHVISVIDIPHHTLFKFKKENENLYDAPHISDVPYSVVALGIIHPDDCEKYIDLFKDIYSGSPSGQLELRVKTINKSWNWYMFYYKTIFDMNNTPIKAISFLEDINDQKTAQAQFAQYKKAITIGAHLTWEVNLSKDEVISYDLHTDHIIKKKDTYTELLNGAFALFAHINMTKELSMFTRENLIETYLSGKKEVSHEFKFEDCQTHEIKWFKSTAYLSRQDSDILAIISIVDITKNVDEHRKLEKRAERDYLTGLFNRETLQERINDLLRNDGLNALIMADIDDFKFYNDQYGHIFGDEIIKHVAKAMKDTFRTSDIIGRIGGDEFVIFMRDIKCQDDVVSRLGHLQKRLVELTHEHMKEGEVTLSLGVTLSFADDDFQSLYKRADEALYQSKEAGKNCIRFHLLQSHDS